MSKHTPGPWRLSGGNTVHSDEAKCIVAFVGTANEEVREFSGARQLADAHLIAASPELLEALETLLTYGCVRCGMEHCERCQAAMDVVHKAKGEQP